MLATRIQSPHATVATPWANLDEEETKAFLAGPGGRRALAGAANKILSHGKSQNHERNRRIRETHQPGKAINDDLDDLSTAMEYQGQAVRGGPARALDRDTWNAIRALVPADFPDLDVLTASAQCGRGESVEIGKKIGLSPRRIRQIQDRHLAWTREHLSPAEILAHLDDPITVEVVTPRAPSRAGRKPKGAIRVPSVLVLVPKVSASPRPVRPYRARRPRVRPACEGQLDMFQFQQAA